jgi:hypothetical protein
MVHLPTSLEAQLLGALLNGCRSGEELQASFQIPEIGTTGRCALFDT